MVKRRKPKTTSLASRKRPAEAALPPPPGAENLDIVVNYGPLREKAYDSLPQKVKDHYEQLVRAPEPDLAAVERLVQEHPDVPVFYNLLWSAYRRVGAPDKATAAATEALRRFPRYLYARTQLAELAMQRGALDLVPEIFDGSFELKTHAPGRREFHSTELVSFYGTLGLYWLLRGDRTAAKNALGTLELVDAGHPLTRRLRDGLAATPLQRVFQGLTGWWKRR